MTDDDLAGVQCAEPHCRKPAKRRTERVDMYGRQPGAKLAYCGLHASMHERRGVQRDEQEKMRLAHQQRERERGERVSYANNVAMMLQTQLGVAFQPNHQGTELSIEIADARALLDRMRMGYE